eukprot:gene14665-19702_t
MIGIGAVILVVGIICSGLEYISSSCAKFDSNMGATFDISDLMRLPGQPSFMVEDGDIPCTTKIEQNYTYIFNVCGAIVDNIPKKCQTLDRISSAGALQIDDRNTPGNDADDYCYLAGTYDDSSSKLSLLNSNDPTDGIQLTYFGSSCSGGVQRKFTIQMPCVDYLNPVPTHALEYSHCEYTITIPSVYGCPLQCPISNRKLCGGNGHCAYDDDKASAHCFCNHGYTGSDCSTASTSSSSSSNLNYSPALLGLIITLFIIVSLLVFGVVYMAKQLEAYKQDIANYQVLKGAEDGVGV